jgi:hypothetical protein
MNKYRRNKKQKQLHKREEPSPTGDEIYECYVCRKKFTFSPPVLGETPFMFVVIADYAHRRMSLMVCLGEELELFEGEQALTFVCADRHCIFKSFLAWRELDVQMNATRVGLEIIKRATQNQKKENAIPPE